jgi:hypothetical protein
VTASTAQSKGLGLGAAAALGFVVWLASFAGASSVADRAWKLGLQCGVVTGGLSGLGGFLLTAPVLGKPMNALVGAMSLGFLARLLLIGAGLVVTVRTLNAEPLGFALAFFPLFFVFAALEILVVVHHAPTGPGAGKES